METVKRIVTFQSTVPVAVDTTIEVELPADVVAAYDQRKRKREHHKARKSILAAVVEHINNTIEEEYVEVTPVDLDSDITVEAVGSYGAQFNLLSIEDPEANEAKEVAITA